MTMDPRLKPYKARGEGEGVEYCVEYWRCHGLSDKWWPKGCWNTQRGAMQRVFWIEDHQGHSIIPRVLRVDVDNNQTTVFYSKETE